MKRALKYIASMLTVLGISSISHFIYAWLGEPSILFPLVPTSEAIFQHIKLCIIPCMIGLWPFYRKDYSIWSMGVVGIEVGILMTLYYYFMVGGLGITGLIPDILTLVVALLLRIPRLHPINKKDKKIIAILTIIALLGCGVLSYVHPDVPFFTQTEHHHDH